MPTEPARHPRPADRRGDVALEPLDADDWFDTVRRSAPFATLPRSAYDATLDLLAGRYPSDEFAELRPRIVWDRDAGTITGRPGAQRLAVTSGGTIPDRGLFGVFMVGRAGPRRVGELDEEMVYESRVGDVFALGATSWRIEEITHDRVLVTPAFGRAGAACRSGRATASGGPPSWARADRRLHARAGSASATPTPNCAASRPGLDACADGQPAGASSREQKQATGARPDRHARSWSSASATSSATGESCCIPRTACRCTRRGRWPCTARVARALRHRRPARWRPTTASSCAFPTRTPSLPAPSCSSSSRTSSTSS